MLISNLPHPALSPYIQYYACLSQSKFFSTPVEEKIPPLPCKAIMFWFYDHPVYTQNDKSSSVLAPIAFIVPQATCSRVSIFSNPWKIFSIVFHPGKMRYLFNFPWLEVLDHHINIIDTEDQKFIDWSKRIQDVDSFEKRVDLCNDFFLKRLPLHRPVSDILDESLKLLVTQNDKKLYEHSRFFNISERHLRRLYKEKLGIPPTDYKKLIRFTKVIDQIHSPSFQKISDIAYKFHFTDPSHLIKDFKFFTGISPLQYLKNNMSSIYADISELRYLD